MSDRIFGGACIALSLLMMWATGLIQESFIQDPLGPKAFPLVIAGIMGLSGLVMIFKPDAEPHWPGMVKLAELLATVGVFIAYAEIMPRVGFVLSTAVATAFLIWRLGGSTRQALIGGVVTSIGIYAVFQHLLGLNLAKGPWGF
jgi:putative tricarboxylic transport membrane protein